MLKHKIWRLSGILALFCIFSVVEANAVPNDITTSKYWSEWVNATSAPSVNLALGKPYAFSVIPMYKLTHYTDGNGTTDKSTTDTTDLTDGAYATTYYNNETIWFNHEAIGWDWEGGGTTDNTGVNIKIDLGVNPVDPVKGYPVDRVVFRVLGGGSQGSIFAPRRIEVFVSKDGINFYKTDAIEKLQSTESALNGTVNPVDGTRYFWLDESNVVNNSFIYNGLTGTTIDATTGAWVYPFILNVQANTRYVGVRVYGATDMVVADELAVMSSLANPAGLDGIYTSGTPESFVAQGITVKPPLDKLVISTNITTPNMLGIHDVRGYLTKSNTANLVMELPEGISLITTPSPLVSPQIMQQQSLVRPSGQKYTKITITPLKDWSGRTSTQPFFFKAETDFPKPGVIPEAVFYSECAGEVTFPQVVPVELITIPVVTPRLDRLHISLGWMGHEEVNAWPDFFTATAPSLPAWKTLGFNFVSGFPYWDRGSLPGQVRANARQYGFKILMQDSPIHRMTESHNWDPKTGYAKAGDEIYSQVPTGDSLNVCPSYVGQWYVQEVARVGLEVKKSKPDAVMWDIEVWTDGAIDATSGKCSRCVAGRLASGKTMDAYLKDQATRALKDLYNSVAAIVPTIPGYRMPTVMGYDYSKYRRYHNFIVDFNQVYPQYIDAAQPSLYVGARPQTIHDEIRANYFGSPGISAAIGINTKDSTFADTRADRKYIIPWLSTGTYANIKPYREYQQVLETILNGAAGLTYFWYGDFDTPLEFYYQAKALAEIAPYEDLIMDGTVLTPTGTNTNLHYSGIMSSLRRDMILLVGNYQKDAAVTTYTAPWGVLSQVTDLETGLPVSTVSGGQITLDILADGTRLLYIMGPLFNITATSGANGAIFPPGVTQYPYGDTPSFIITPASGYWLKSLVVDRASQDTQLGQRNFYTFLPIITDNHTIDVTFKPFYTITASSGANGAIVPGGKILAGQGESRTFTIRSNSGYRINTLLVDGVLTDTTSGDTQYTFANITGNHTIAVTFQVTHTIAASNGAHGKISPLGTLTVGHGETQAFTITPDAGYCLATMLIDGVSRDTGISGSLGSYVFTNVIVNHKIVVTFKLSRAITATAGSGGSISPVGIIPIGYGDAQTFTIAPTLGNQLVALLVDGVLKDTGGGNLPSYTFINVTANHTIAASFEINTYTITASAGLNGSITPSATFNYGATPTFTITPALGYHVLDVLVDGISVGAVTSYPFSAVTANHTIAATFAIDIVPFTIIASPGSGGLSAVNGAITPSGVVKVGGGNTQTFMFTPASGYRLATLTVDGVSQNTQNNSLTNYTFSAVTANHTISATFAISTFTITASAGANGAISPKGAVKVNYGVASTFTITRASGYVLATLMVDGVSQDTQLGKRANYTFSAVTANHTIAVTFKKFYTITASAGANGSISPSGSVTVGYRDTQKFTIKPNAGYVLATLIVDGLPKNTQSGSLTSYTFSTVTTTHRITVTFKKI